jgi:hypothetical protein
MEIGFETKANLTAEIKVEVVSSDYSEVVDKALK